MKGVIAALAVFLASSIGAHALAYAMLTYLPDPAVTALGMAAAQASARAAYEATRPTRSYPEVLSDLCVGRLGTTLDGVPVRQEMASALVASLPRLAAAVGLVAGAIGLTAFAPTRALKPIGYIATLLAFLPPFTAPFVGLGLLLAAPAIVWKEDLPLAWILSVVSIAAPAAALAAAQAAAVTERNLSRPFAITLRAAGASKRRQRRRLLRNLAVELAPTLEKLGVGLFVALLFAEPLLGLGGFGDLMLSAIRRTDVDTILAAVLAMAIVVNVLRLAARFIRRASGLAPP